MLKVALPLPLFLIMVLSGAHEAGAVDQIGIYLMPAAADNGNGYVRLTCGWHQGCDGIPDDPGYGALDFVKEGHSALGEYSFWRVKAYSSSPSIISVGKLHRWGC